MLFPCSIVGNGMKLFSGEVRHPSGPEDNDSQAVSQGATVELQASEQLGF